jgi:hypothetical protein
MNHSTLQDSQHALEAQLLSANAPWQLDKGCAVTLRPRVAGVLRVMRGRAWATIDVSRYSPMADAGDHFVAPGHDLPLRAGQRVVLESWPVAGESSVSLVWEPLTAPECLSRWQTAVVEPLRDVGQGLSITARAMVRLSMGLAGYREFLVAGRGRVLPKLESNAP